MTTVDYLVLFIPFGLMAILIFYLIFYFVKDIVNIPKKTFFNLKNQKTTMIIVIVVSLVVGYFVGREHLKYEIRSKMRETLQIFKR